MNECYYGPVGQVSGGRQWWTIKRAGGRAGGELRVSWPASATEEQLKRRRTEREREREPAPDNEFGRAYEEEEAIGMDEIERQQASGRRETSETTLGLRCETTTLSIIICAQF